MLLLTAIHDTVVLFCITRRGRVFLTKQYLQVGTLSRDPELYGLLYGVHSKNIPGHLYRGYSILDEDSREVSVSEFDATTERRRRLRGVSKKRKSRLFCSGGWSR